MRSINVLVIEDDDLKYDVVSEKLQKGLTGLRVEVSRARNYDQALFSIENSYLDLVILDLLMPSLDGSLSTVASEVLLEKLLSSDTKSSPLVIGLTAHKETFDEMREKYASRLLLLELYEPLDHSWYAKVIQKVEQLSTMRQSYLNFFRNTSTVDLLIVTARHENEFLPITKSVRWVGGKPPIIDGENGIITTSGNARISGRQISTRIICMGQMGLSATAAITTRLIMEYRPKVLVMLGMCCGFRVDKAAHRCKLLDVVVVKDTVCWDEGKYYDTDERGISGFSFRPEPLQIAQDESDRIRRLIERDHGKFQSAAERIVQKARTKNNFEAFGDQIADVPSLIFGRNVSGMNVVSRKALIEEIVARTPTAVSLEMEIYSVFKAASVVSGLKPKVICIKGVADFGEEKDAGDYDAVQPVASILSYEALKFVLGDLVF